MQQDYQPKNIEAAAQQYWEEQQAFRADDGHFTAGVPSPNLWKAFLGVLGLEQLEMDPRFATNADRHANRAELIRMADAAMYDVKKTSRNNISVANQGVLV